MPEISEHDRRRIHDLVEELRDYLTDPWYYPCGDKCVKEIEKLLHVKKGLEDQ